MTAPFTQRSQIAQAFLLKKSNQPYLKLLKLPLPHILYNLADLETQYPKLHLMPSAKRKIRRPPHCYLIGLCLIRLGFRPDQITDDDMRYIGRVKENPNNKPMYHAFRRHFEGLPLSPEQAAMIAEIRTEKEALALKEWPLYFQPLETDTQHKPHAPRNRTLEPYKVDPAHLRNVATGLPQAFSKYRDRHKDNRAYLNDMPKPKESKEAKETKETQ